MSADGPDLSGLVRPLDVDTLVAEVRKQGLERARERLVDAYADALVQAVTRGTPTPEPASSLTTGCYVYAVVSGDGTGAAGAGDGIEPGGTVRVVTAGGISAVVSDVDLEAMRKGGSCDEIAEDGWLANAVRAHERVVLAAFHSAPTIPMRFGIVHPDQASVERLLRAHAGDFQEELSRVTAAAEWSVRVYVDADVAVGSGGDGPTAPTATTDTGDGGTATSGTTYLLRARERRARDERIRTELQRTVDGLTTTLGEIARDVVMTPQTVADGRNGVFSAAYLVNRDDEHRLVAAADAFNEGAEASGVTVEVAGPWPPDHFTTLRLEADHG